MRRAKALLVLAVLSTVLAGCAPPLSEAELSDTGILTRVERTLAAHRELDLHAVTIDVHMRTVTISGTVPTYSDKRTIEQLMNATPGVEQVVVNLVVPE